MFAVAFAGSPHPGALAVEGSLRAPIGSHVTCGVKALLRRGARAIVVDLARVSGIDAAGVGELVRAYNLALTANAVLQIVEAPGRVRRMLECAGLFDLLSEGLPDDALRPEASGEF
jgi:anti-anti-sigma factor